MLDKQSHICENCQRKVFRSITNKCMYCGQALPATMKLTADELEAYKERHLELEKESQAFLQGMRPGKPSLQDEAARKRKHNTPPAELYQDGEGAGTAEPGSSPDGNPQKGQFEA